MPPRVFPSTAIDAHQPDLFLRKRLVSIPRLAFYSSHRLVTDLGGSVLLNESIDALMLVTFECWSVTAQVACAMPAGVVQTAEVPTLTALELEARGGGALLRLMGRKEHCEMV
ncbi:unnamed protein product [Calypogeia fissa]